VVSGENQPMAEREAGTEIWMQLLEKSLEASKLFIFIFLFDQAS
jgi:hypothetical protein